MEGEKKSTVSISEGGRPAWVVKGEPEVVGLRLLHSDVTFEFGNLERLTVGTDPNHDIVLGDPTVSGTHCVLERDGTRVLMQDLGSRNGTYINGIPCQRVQIRDGAIVIIGRSHLVAYSEANRNRRVANERIAGHDPGILQALRQAERAAVEGRNVLIVGEPGTGKALFAQVIHELARGPGLPFVTVDCTTADAASVLFGTEPSALDQAAGGTLFVKEPAKLSGRNLGRLFEALRDRGVQEPASLRMVAATSYVSETIRPYEAISPVLVTLPPLRERKGDIPELVERSLHALLGKQRREPSKLTMAALMRYDWPGNVAELHEAVRIIVALGTSTSKSQAAERIPMKRTTLDRRIARLGLPKQRQGDSLW